VPGNITDERNRGCHQLIRDGAKLVECAQDVLCELGLQSDAEEASDQLPLPIESLNDSERRIASLLSLEPLGVDEIIERCGLPAPMVSGTLTILEMKSVVKRVPGNAYVRKL